MIHVVDTHALTRYFEDLDLLGAAGRALMTHADATLVVPTIVVAEAKWMIQKRRAKVGWDDLLTSLDHDGRFFTSPLTLEIVRVAPPGLEMHDAIICATAMLLHDSLGEDVAVITRDKEIRESGLVETVW